MERPMQEAWNRPLKHRPPERLPTGDLPEQSSTGWPRTALFDHASGDATITASFGNTVPTVDVTLDSLTGTLPELAAGPGFAGLAVPDGGFQGRHSRQLWSRRGILRTAVAGTYRIVERAGPVWVSETPMAEETGIIGAFGTRREGPDTGGTWSAQPCRLAGAGSNRH